VNKTSKSLIKEQTMSDYIRTTRECSANELRPELLKAIQDYFLGHAVGNLQSDVIICCETVSRKKNVGKTPSWIDGRPDTTTYTGMVLTSQWFIWAHQGDQTGIQVHAASLNEIQADFYTSLFSKDAGLRIVGFVGEDNTRIRGYIGMGNDQAAQKFCAEVKQAILKANPSTQKDMFKWFGR
jgi:hypothetical protein